MVQINHKIGNFFFSILAGIVINGTMRSAIWEYLRGTFAFPQQCPPASLSTLYCSLHFTPAALIGSLHFHCFIFFYTAVVVIRKGNQPCPASWRHSCSSQSWSASPEPSVSFCFHHFFLNDKILFCHFLIIQLWMTGEIIDKQTLFPLVFSSVFASEKCLCRRTRGLRGMQTQIKDLHIYPQTVFCRNVEIV